MIYINRLRTWLIMFLVGNAVLGYFLFIGIKLLNFLIGVISLFVIYFIGIRILWKLEQDNRIDIEDIEDFSEECDKILNDIDN